MTTRAPAEVEIHARFVRAAMSLYGGGEFELPMPEGHNETRPP